MPGSPSQLDWSATEADRGPDYTAVPAAPLGLYL